MSEPEQAPKTPPAVAVYAEIPEHFAPKQKLAETEGKETWEIFDRVKKRTLILKRYKAGFVDAAVFQRFQDDLTALQERRPDTAEWPGIIAIGQDADGIWLLRERNGERSLNELLGGGKTLKPHDAARRFLALTNQLSLLHATDLMHGNLKPAYVFTSGIDQATFADTDAGAFHDRTLPRGDVPYKPEWFGETDFLAPEQRSDNAASPDARSDLWSLSALLGFALTGKIPAEQDAEALPEPFRELLTACLKDDPAERTLSTADFAAQLDQIVKKNRPSAFDTPAPAAAPVADPPATPVVPTAQPSSMPTPAPVPPTTPVPPPAAPQPAAYRPEEGLPPGTSCPQCHTPVRSASDRVCSQCGRHFLEPCLNCQSMNPFWLRTCVACGSDMVALKQQMLATLNGQKQQILKLRENYGHDKTLPLLKYMSTVNHPDFHAFREWAKSMTALVQKERREVKAYVDQVRAQVNSAMTAQKYDKARKILEQVPRPLLDEPMRKIYVDAGDALTEVDSLIREIRNAIATKQYSPLLSCVQRYLELKANDPEARSLQQKIEKLTTVTSHLGMKLRRIPSGRFYMGSHDSDEYLRNNESPQHKVLMTHNLFVGVYQVTQADFKQVMEYNPSVSTENDACPVDSVTWFSALEFCNKMSDLEELPHYYELNGIKRRSNGSIERARVTTLGGEGYRLPTEAEWEYACRAGSISPWCFGDQVMDVGEYAWYYDNSGMETHPVGEKKPNAWGLCDFHGNIMEWCHDWYDEYYYQQRPDEEEDPAGPEDGIAKVLRGGAWQFGAEATRCAYRNSSSPDTASSVIGLRVCRNATDDVMQ